MRRLRQATGSRNEEGGGGPLRVALRCNDQETLRALLRVRRNDVNHASDHKEGLTLLHEACAMANKEMVEILLAHGADPCALDHHGRSPKEALPPRRRSSALPSEDLAIDDDGRDPQGAHVLLISALLDAATLESEIAHTTIPSSPQERAAIDYSALCPREVKDVHHFLEGFGDFIVIKAQRQSDPPSQ